MGRITLTAGGLVLLTACRSLPSGGLYIRDSIEDAAFLTPDGSIFLTPKVKGWRSQYNHVLQTWNIKRRQWVWSQEITGNSEIVVSPNARLVAIVERTNAEKAESARTTILETSTGNVVRRLEVEHENLLDVERWALSDQGTFVAMTISGLIVNGPTFPPEGHTWEAHAVWGPKELFFNSGGDKLCGAYGSGTVTVFALENGSVRVVDELEPVVRAVWGPFGLALAMDDQPAGWDGTTIKTWTALGEVATPPPPHLRRYDLTQYSFYPTDDGRAVAVWLDGYNHLAMIDPRTGAHLWERELLYRSKVCSNVATTAKTAVYVDCEGNMVELDRATGRERRRVFLGLMTEDQKGLFGGGGWRVFYYRAKLSANARYLEIEAIQQGPGDTGFAGHIAYDVEELF